MVCYVWLFALIPSALSLWVWFERRRYRRMTRKQIENDSLRIQLDRLKQAAQIDAEIDALSDDQLRERLRESSHRHDQFV